MKLTKEREEKLKQALDQLEQQLYSDWGLRRINGGFVNAEYKGIENGEINITIEAGTQDENGSDIQTYNHTLEVEHLDKENVLEIIAEIN